MKEFNVQYETKLTMNAVVKANTEEEAIALVKSGQYEDGFEEKIEGFEVVSVVEKELMTTE